MVHFFAVFGAEIARAPEGLEGPVAASRPHHPYPSADELQAQESQCKQLLEKAFTAFKPSTRKKHFPGKGTGFSYEHSPFCSYASRDGVHVLMTGEVAAWPGIDVVSASHDAFVRNEQPLEADDAHWLLDFYRTFTAEPDDDRYHDPEEVMSRALACLARIKGNFGFVVYDSLRHRVLAARDREGVSPLYWGATDNGQLVFGSDPADLAECNPTATAFPSGCLFTSERHMLAVSPGERGWVLPGDDVPGQLLSFLEADDAAHYRGIKAIPRITSKGVMCGAVYKVGSCADMSKPIQ